MLLPRALRAVPFLAAAVAAQSASAQSKAPDAAPPASSSAAPGPAAPDEISLLSKPPGPTYSWFTSLFFGDGFRFNNPYRLHTQLGESARTVSVTDAYADIGTAFTVGNVYGFQHGAALNLSFTLPSADNGGGQSVLVPAYFVAYRGSSDRLLGFGRFGPAIILNPDANVGGELGLGGALFLTGHVAVAAEIVGDLFYGAATRETAYPVYPIVSLQLGLMTDYEVLP